MFHNIKRIIAITLVIITMVCVLPTTAYAKTDYKIGVAVVNGSALRLRESDNLFAKVLDKAEKGDIVVVLDKVGDWCKVNYNLQEGYMHASYLNFVEKENIELGYGKVSGSRVNMRSGPSTKSNSVKILNNNDPVYIIGINNGWYKVIFNGKIGYVRSDYVELTEIPYENFDSNKNPLFFKNGKLFASKVDVNLIGGANTTTEKQDTVKDDAVNKNDKPQEKPIEPAEPAQQPDVETPPEANQEPDVTTPPETNKNDADNEAEKKDEPIIEKVEDEVKNEPEYEGGPNSSSDIVELAKQYLGTPYMYGGTSPNGFDCSGFVYYVFNNAGYKLSRTMKYQYEAGTPIAKENLKPGDIVFFQNTYKPGLSHAGIYVGNGQFIHAPSTGKVVSYASLNTAYYVSHYYGACRIG